MEWLFVFAGVVVALFIVNWLVAWRHKDGGPAAQGRTHEGWDAEHGGGDF